MTGIEPRIDADEAWRTAFDGCLAGYPLVMLDEARRRHPTGSNQFAHVRPGGADAVGLSAPNPHVVYSTAWLDLRGGPVVVSLPELRARHFVMPMIDAWGSIFTSLGVRRRGEGAQHLVVVGPDWSGASTDDLPVVRSPTNAVWLLGRTLADAFEDDAAGPWNDYYLTVKGVRPGAALPAGDDRKAWEPWPSADLASIDSDDFLDRMAALMTRHPPPPSFSSVCQRLGRLGITRLSPFEIGKLEPDLAAAARAGGRDARQRVEATAWPSASPGSPPWIALSRPGGGRLEPLERAAIAHRGFGFNLREDAVYFLTNHDADGLPLQGDLDYRLHFAPLGLPPVGAFWSLAAYDLDGGLAASADGRTGLSSREPLRFNLDGSLELRIQRRRPAGPMAMNWLPTPAAPFRLILRAYGPGKPVLDGRWSPPPLLRTVAEQRPRGRGLGPPGGAASGRTVDRLRTPPDIGDACGA